MAKFPHETQRCPPARERFFHLGVDGADDRFSTLLLVLSLAAGLPEPRAPMDPLAALLSERPPQQLSVTELRARIALLEDAARAYRAELESRTTRLDALPDEIQQVIFGQLCNALDPRSAVAYSSASKGLRELMQRVGEGAGKSPLQQLKEENAAAAALGRKLGGRSCKSLRWAMVIQSCITHLSTTDLATLGKLTPVLPALGALCLVEQSGSADPDGVLRAIRAVDAKSDVPPFKARALSRLLASGGLDATASFEHVDSEAGEALGRLAAWCSRCVRAALRAAERASDDESSVPPRRRAPRRSSPLTL